MNETTDKQPSEPRPEQKPASATKPAAKATPQSLDPRLVQQLEEIIARQRAAMGLG